MPNFVNIGAIPDGALILWKCADGLARIGLFNGFTWIGKHSAIMHVWRGDVQYDLRLHTHDKSKCDFFGFLLPKNNPRDLGKYLYREWASTDEAWDFLHGGSA